MEPKITFVPARRDLSVKRKEAIDDRIKRLRTDDNNVVSYSRLERILQGLPEIKKD